MCNFIFYRENINTDGCSREAKKKAGIFSFNDRGQSDGLIIERRELVTRINNLRIIIRPNEHAPPHFHVESDNINASFDILTCELLRGKINGKDLRRIEAFHNTAKERLISTWNRLRPSDCPVGPIKNEEKSY